MKNFAVVLGFGWPETAQYRVTAEDDQQAVIRAIAIHRSIPYDAAQRIFETEVIAWEAIEMPEPSPSPIASVSVRIISEVVALRVLGRMTYLSWWFSFMPLPDDIWEITVRRENETKLKQLINDCS